MFESGRHTNHANVATIVKIGIALKRLLGAAGDAPSESSQKEDTYEFHMLDEDESALKKAAVASASASTKSYSHLNDPTWKTFCDGRLRHYETKWTKKLEDYTDEDNKEIVSDQEDGEDVVLEEADDETENHKYFDADAVEAGGRSLSKSQTFDSKTGKWLDITEDDRRNSKDDWAVSANPSPDYLSNTFWKVPDAYSIDDLLKEQEGL